MSDKDYQQAIVNYVTYIKKQILRDAAMFREEDADFLPAIKKLSALYAQHKEKERRSILADTLLDYSFSGYKIHRR